MSLPPQVVPSHSFEYNLLSWAIAFCSLIVVTHFIWTKVVAVASVVLSDLGRLVVAVLIFHFELRATYRRLSRLEEEGPATNED